ncbi:MAG TPA: response regulator [Syntrophorhabdaceae bacterium]|nr:response regulator [Syntrophorhabdaceae bacterium]
MRSCLLTAHTDAHSKKIMRDKNIRILILDDQESVRTTIGMILQHLGYETHLVAAREDAIDSYRQAKRLKDPFDIVILDLYTPDGMGGKEVFEELRAMDPEVYAIVSSGYVNDPLITDYESYGFKAALVKPYRIEDLTYILEQASTNKQSTLSHRS